MNSRVKKVIIVSLVTGATLFHGSEKLFSKDYLTNQSAEYHRTFSRNASTDSADIVNYNPAGTAFMADGLYINIGDQFLYHKTNDITYQGQTYSSDEPANIPSAFIVYKKSKFAFFGAFTVPAGGGSVNYKNGFPMMKMNCAKVKEKAIPVIQEQAAHALDTNDTIGGLYSYEGALELVQEDVDLSGTTVTWGGGALEGSSLYFGGTAGLAVQADNRLSVSAGLRVIYAVNKYKGNTTYIIDPVAEASGFIPGQVADGINKAENVTEVVELDAEMTALGLGQIIGIDFKPFDSLLVGFRYETATPLTWKEKVKDGKDFAGKYVDGRETHKDLPAHIAGGIHYNILSNLAVSGSFVYHFLKDSDAGEDNGDTVFGYDDDYTNPYDLTAAVEYRPIKWLLLSAGYSYTENGGNQDTFTDTDHSLSCNTLGGGFALTVLDNLTINGAWSRVFYKDGYNTAGEKFQKEVDSAAMSVQYVFFTASANEDTDADDVKEIKKEKKAKKEKKTE